MIHELGAYLKSSPAARLNLWLGRDRCRGLHDLKGMGFQRSNWTETCVGYLAKENRCAAIVANYSEPILIQMLASQEMMPPMIRRPGEAAGSSEAALTLFLPESLEQTDGWARQIVAAAGKHPWVIAGVNDLALEDCAILSQIAATGADMYWVPKWSNPVPTAVSFHTKRISGHDSDTFFAALLETQGSFPPCIATPAYVEGNPADGLNSLLHKACGVFSDAAGQVIKDWLPETAELTALDEETFRQRMKQVWRSRLAVLTLGGENATRKLVFGTFTAGLFSGGRRADEFFGLSWTAIQELPESFRMMGFDRFETQMDILRRRARLRTPAGAEPLYEEGSRLIRALQKPEPKSPRAAILAAELYADWSSNQPPVSAKALIDQAVEILHRPGAVRKLVDYQESPLIHTECRILRGQAQRLQPEDAKHYLNAARSCAERFAQLTISSLTKSSVETMRKRPFFELERSDGMRDYYLGLIALEEARLFPDREDNLVDDASRYFERMLQETQTNPVWLYLDWAVALGQLARSRDGSQSKALYARANELLQMSADVGDSASLQASWSALLLDQSWQAVGTRREELLGAAEHHARQAESFQTGKGMYYLACVAAHHRHESEVVEYLRLCSRYPTLPARTAFDIDPHFTEVRNQDWFQNLGRELYPN